MPNGYLRRHDASSANRTESLEIAILPRYLIERDFPDGLTIPPDETGATLCRTVADNNAEDGVTWLHSYVTPNRQRTFCIYDGPTPEAVRRAAVPPFVTNCPSRGSQRFAFSIPISINRQPLWPRP
jgi:hypothetical protein